MTTETTVTEYTPAHLATAIDAMDVHVQALTIALIGMILDRTIEHTRAGNPDRVSHLALCTHLLGGIHPEHPAIPMLKDSIEVIGRGEELRDPEPWPAEPAWLPATDERVTSLIGQRVELNTDYREWPDVATLTGVDAENVQAISHTDDEEATYTRALWRIRPCSGV